MPITFTDADFETESSLKFTEEDFGPTPITKPLKVSPYEQARAEGQETGMEAGTEFTQALNQAVFQDLPAGISKVTQPVAKPIGKVLAGALLPLRLLAGQRGYSFQAPAEGQSYIPELEPQQSEQGIIPSSRRFAAGMLTDENLGTLAAAPESKLIAGLYGAQTLLTIPESIQALAASKTAAEKRGALTDIALKGTLGALLTRTAERTPNASEIRTPEALHGNVRSFEARSEVLPPEGGSPGIQSQTQTPGAEGQPRVLLTPEHADILNKERQAIDQDVEVVDRPLSENEPFARQIATIDRANGKILINPKEFGAWIQQVPEKQRARAVRSLLNEEQIHLQVSDEDAMAYHEALTGAEKALGARRYTGNWRGLDPATGQPVSPLLQAHENLRYRMQRLSRMDPREAIEAAGREKWTVKGINALEDAIYNVRKNLGTKASKEQLAITDRILGNLDAMKAAVSGSAPAAIRKGQEDQAEKFGIVTDSEGRSHIPVTIERPDGTRYQAQFNGYYDLRDFGGGTPESIGRYLESGDLTHGNLREGEKLITKVPTIDEWNATTEKPDTSLFRRQPAAIRKQHFGMPEPDRKYEPEVTPPDFTPGQFVTVKAGETGEKFQKNYQEKLNELGTALFMGNINPMKENRWRDIANNEADVAELDALHEKARNQFAAGDQDELYITLSQIAARMKAMEAGQEQVFPAAIRKQRDVKQEEMFLPPLLPGEKVERPSAETFGSKYATATPQAVQQSAYSHLQAEMDKAAAAVQSGKPPSAPSFEDFKTAIKQQFGQVPDEAVKDAWNQSIWQPLINASGEKLEALRTALNLRSAVGSKRISDPLGERQFTLEQEGEGAKAARKGAEQSAAAREKYRRTVIGAIGRKLLRQGEEGRSLNPKEISPEELAYDVKAVRPAFNALTSQERADPVTLQKILADDARVSGKPVSVTKRLTVLQDKATGKVEMVSTYRDPRRGTVLLDPAAPKGTHVALNTILSRYRPIYSLLLGEPVQGFRQSFPDLGTFEREFGNRAKRAQETSFIEPAPMEGEFQPSPTGGKVATPGMFIDRPGTLEEGEHIPLTGAEAGSILDQIMGEVGRFDSPDDVKASLNALKEDENRQALSGYRKLFGQLERKYPDASVEELLDRLADQIYENHNSAKDYEDFVRRTVAQAGTAAREALGRESQPLTFSESDFAKELTMPIERVPPTTVRPEQVPPGSMLPKVPAPPVPEGTPFGPGAIRKRIGEVKEAAKEQYELTTDSIKAMISRHQVEELLPRKMDGLENSERADALAAAQEILLDSIPEGERERVKTLFKGNNPVAVTKRIMERVKTLADAKKRREAVIAMVSTGYKHSKTGEWHPAYSKLKTFEYYLTTGEQNARAWMRDKNPFKRRAGKAWLNYIGRLREGIEYARDHWDDPLFRKTVDTYRREMHNAIEYENAFGNTTPERDNYFPGLYEAEYFADNVINFGPKRLLGEAFRKGKSFADPYEAAREGPYILRSMDAADVAEHRIATGRRQIARRLWLESLKKITDRVSGKPLATEPELRFKTITEPMTGTETQEPYYKAPSPDYKLLYPHSNSKPIAVRAEFADGIASVMAPSRLNEFRIKGWAPFRDARIASSMLKHGVLLILDTFHPGRLAQYAMALTGGKLPTHSGGFSALSYRPESLAKAVDRGFISPEAAAWAQTPIEIRRGSRTIMMPRWQVAHDLVRNGLNAVRLGDAMYRDAVQNIPFIGERYHKIISPYNKSLFDRFVPGLMVESAVRNYEKLLKTGMKAEDAMADTIKDINTFYGNLGRQGIFSNATVRDLASIFLLAPLWQEGLLMKDLRGLSRTTGLSALLGRRRPTFGAYMGPLGTGWASGLAAYFILTQAINLITRRQFTFQNEEEGHKLDAWIPTGEKSGFWLNPMATFAEVIHDVIRLAETKPRIWDALRQIGENRLGPVGRMWGVLRSGESPTGEKYSSAGGVLAGAAEQLTGGPITFSPLLREAAHAIAPNQVSPNPPGTLWRQLIASGAGVKVQTAETPIQEMQQRARHWMENSPYKKETGWEQVITDEPSYSKLRRALRFGDVKEARRAYNGLKKTHTDQQIFQAMSIWARRPFTGSYDAERAFLSELSEKELERYTEAMEEKQKMLNLFMEFYVKELE